MKCRIVKIIYQNKDSGFSVVACNTEDTSVPQAARNGYCKKEIQFTVSGMRRRNGQNIRSKEKITVDVKSAMRYNIIKGKDERYGKNRNCQEY